MSIIIDQDVASVSPLKPMLAHKPMHAILTGAIVAMLALMPANPRDAHALVGGVVFDPTNFYANLNTFYQTVEQVRAQYQQLEALYSQIRTLEAQLNSMTSKSYWTEQLPQYKSWTPMSWQDIQKMIEAGFNPGDGGDAEAYARAKQRHQQRYPRLTQQQVSNNENAVQWTEYQDTYDATSSALGMAEAAQEQIKNYELAIKTLKGQVKESETSDALKSSVDLTNNMLLQMLSLQLDQMKLGQHTLHVLATRENSRLRGRETNAVFLDAKPPVLRTP